MMRCAARILALPVLLLALLATGQVQAGSGGETKSGDQKQAAPERPFTIAVMGDSLSDGLWGSLYRRYVKFRKLVVVERHGVNSAGFTAHNFERDFEKVAKQPVDLIIFMVGANDRQRAFSVTNARHWARFRSDQWFAIYRQNVDRFLDLVQSKKIPLIWVGLPIMRKADASEDARMMNGIFSQLVALHDDTFIDIWRTTADGKGSFDPYIKDSKGRERRFRADDGIHFTEYGYDHVARYVMKVAQEKLPQFQALWSVSAP
jgi:hypothetical protein